MSLLRIVMSLLSLLAVSATGLAQRVAGNEGESAAIEEARPRVELQGGAVLVRRGESTRKLALPCRPLAAIELDGEVIVACGQAGVLVVVDVSREPAREQRRLAVDGAATGVFVAGGRVWVVVARREARPLDELHVAGSLPGTAPGERAVPPPWPAPSDA